MQARVEYPVVTAAIEIFTDWWKNRKSHDLRYLPASEVDRIAVDVGMSVSELRAMDERPDRPLLLLPMLKVLGLDPAAIKRTDPLVFRDLERCCAMCAVQKRCSREFAKGTAAANYQEFCPNSLTLQALA